MMERVKLGGPIHLYGFYRPYSGVYVTALCGVGAATVSKAAELDPPICEFCGDLLVNDDQLRPACNDGRCCYL